MPLSRVHLILVEDDDLDAEYVVRVLRRSGIGVPVTLFHDGPDYTALCELLDVYEKSVQFPIST